MDYIDTFPSPIGDITISSDGENLTGLWFDGQKYFMATIDEATYDSALPLFKETRAWLDAYFTGKNPGPIPPVKPQGTAFRQRVWKHLCEIPYGGLSTYGELAKKIAAEEGKATWSARAVGGAVGHNPISIIVPCHRVIGTNGSLTGFGGGIARKITLLELEGVDLSECTVPTKGTAL